ncbi:hypothetical protein KHA80_21035 [Anaerobacillus sp. HL2]|nr:hypothetical protein KHA80_21035 [Anaerobacillus sp. HL2]
MLGLHGEIYLKKRNSHKAKGIIKATKDEAGYHFIYSFKGEKILKEEK